MRRIQIEDGLCVRFPGRGEEFNEGVEIGIIAVLMSSGQRGFTHWISGANLEQARSLAERMGYRMTEGDADGGLREAIFRTGSARPKLTLVHSRCDAGQNVA